VNWGKIPPGTIFTDARGVPFREPIRREFKDWGAYLDALYVYRNKVEAEAARSFAEGFSKALKIRSEVMAKLRCDMELDCAEAVTHIDCKGFVYCTKHGAQRKQGGVQCRRLRRAEVGRIEGGGSIRYR
jgi:hypothetical protein